MENRKTRKKYSGVQKAIEKQKRVGGCSSNGIQAACTCVPMIASCEALSSFLDYFPVFDCDSGLFRF